MAGELQRAKASMKAMRARLSGPASRVERSAGAFLGGATVGVLEHQGIMGPTLLGMPTKPMAAGVAYLLSKGSSGLASRMLQAAGDGLMGAYGYAAGKAGTLIAGDDGDDGDSPYAEDAQLGF